MGPRISRELEAESSFNGSNKNKNSEVDTNNATSNNISRNNSNNSNSNLALNKSAKNNAPNSRSMRVASIDSFFRSSNPNTNSNESSAAAAAVLTNPATVRTRKNHSLNHSLSFNLNLPLSRPSATPQPPPPTTPTTATTSATTTAMTSVTSASVIITSIIAETAGKTEVTATPTSAPAEPLQLVIAPPILPLNIQVQSSLPLLVPINVKPPPKAESPPVLSTQGDIEHRQQARQTIQIEQQQQQNNEQQQNNGQNIPAINTSQVSHPPAQPPLMTNSSLFLRRFGNNRTNSLRQQEQQQSQGNQQLFQVQIQHHSSPFPSSIPVRSLSSPSPNTIYPPDTSGTTITTIRPNIIAPNRLDLSSILAKKAPQTESPISGSSQSPQTTTATTPHNSHNKHDQMLLARINTLPGPARVPVWLHNLHEVDLAFKAAQVLDNFRIHSSSSSSMPPPSGSIARTLIDAGWFTNNDDDERTSSQNANLFKTSAANSMYAARRNRYTDIVPYDYTRVHLRQQQPSDYINASYISTCRLVPSRKRRRRRQAGDNNNNNPAGKTYIATQAPLRSTVGDFWNMIVDNGTRVVVMLTREEEKGRVKCCRYWPSLPLQALPVGTAGDVGLLSAGSSIREPDEFVWLRGSSDGNVEIEVSPHGVERFFWGGDIVVRQFDIVLRTRSSRLSAETATAGNNSDDENTKDNSDVVVLETRLVSQVQYLGWPDHKGADPDSVLAVIDMANRMQREAIAAAAVSTRVFNAESAVVGPMVVHCSAGCGRTGAFIVIDSVLGILEHGVDFLLESEDEDDNTNTESTTAAREPITEQQQQQQQHQHQPITESTTKYAEFLSRYSQDPVFRCMMTLRTQRMAMVQTIDQYLLCYEAIIARLCEWEKSGIVGVVPAWKTTTTTTATGGRRVSMAATASILESLKPAAAWKTKMDDGNSVGSGGNGSEGGGAVSMRRGESTPTSGVSGVVGGGRVFDWDAALRAQVARQ
ncbi:hypothetical protein HK100_007371 [Physocladia obscura]|uniref:Uncharacterized protein n=1 Tax=Physocladia obscura TaxID=109957 RepID=A0AAD5SRS5_9FUNG|nr:hypothetical protein HK100_007371 [Physocladia obscura]